MFRTRAMMAAAVAATLALGACGDSSGSEQARLSIRLTDAPGDLAEAWVKIDDIYLQRGEGAGQGEDGGEEAGRVDLLASSTGWVDLLTLAGGTTATLVNGAVVPAGSYSELRFVVCDAYIRTNDGDVYATPGTELPAGVSATGELKGPSFCQSGLKVKLPGGAVSLENDATILVVDFDVSQSFGHQAGNSGKWVMHPVLHATEVGFSGGIGGTVAAAEGVALPACGGAATDLTLFVPRATAGGTTVSGITRADGTFTIAPVSPATYTLGFADVVGFSNGDTLTFAASANPASVSVGSGGSASAAYTVTAATCKVKA